MNYKLFLLSTSKIIVKLDDISPLKLDPTIFRFHNNFLIQSNKINIKS